MKYVFFLTLASLMLACAEPEPEGGRKEFYGKIVYTIDVGGMVDSSVLGNLRESFGDSIAVYFSDKGYRLHVYKEKPVTEWFDNRTGMIYVHIEGERVLSVKRSTEENPLMGAGHAEAKPTILGRQCQTYFMHDDQFQIEMSYDSNLYISPSRFSQLIEGHYYRYYADCHSPYLRRSIVMPPLNIRIEARRIEIWDEPDPEWAHWPDYPQKPLKD